MKRLLIVCGIVVAILGVSAFSLFHLAHVTEEMEAHLELLSEALAQKNNDQLIQLADDFKLLWEDNEAEIMHYVQHDELDAISGTVARLPALARYREYPELAAEIARMKHLIYHIYENEVPGVKTIF